jgi:MEDS: MEthanogen/methylotroph, DcmR Sensory domain
MKLCPGDHVCSLYDTDEELAATVASFLADGLARAERCWYVPSSGGVEGVRTAMEITYEALLRTLFSTSPATGLCLYDRRRMPLQVVNGALLTHPIVEVSGGFSRNQLYDPTVKPFVRRRPILSPVPTSTDRALTPPLEKTAAGQSTLNQPFFLECRAVDAPTTPPRRA